jgi:SagB-type dehydrogenase family enzyme
VSLETAIAQRRSVRRYGPATLSLKEIGQLLWSAQGITGKGSSRRAAPSAGGRHPLVFYVCRSDSIWRYYPQGHTMRQHLTRDVREDLAEAAWRQDFIGEAPCVFAVSAIYERTRERYQERARRYVPMDVGHATENLNLQAVALGLGSVSVGAFDDDAVKQVLALPDEEEPMYLIPVGHPRER